MSSGRSSRISTLSDKIQGLKFMQRASASSPSSSTPASTSNSPVVQQQSNKPSGVISKKGDERIKSKEVVKQSKSKEEESDANDEHWSLPPSVRASKISKKASVSRIESQTGWNDWLNQFQQSSESNTTETPNARKSFGFSSPSKDRKQKLKAEEVQDEGEVENDVITNRGFIKPGTLSNSPSNKVGSKKRKSEGHDEDEDDNDEILLDIRKEKKKKKDKHAEARKESAIKKRNDMASNGKSSKRRKEGFIVPDLNKEGDSDEFDSSDIEATLRGFQE